MPTRAVVAALLLAAACGGDAAQGEERHVVDWHQYPLTGTPPPQDRGVGVVYFARLPGTATVATTDSLVVLADTTAGADTVGIFLLREGASDAYRYGLASADSLQPNAVEFDYEIAGLPIDTLAGGGRWARAIVGFDAEGRPRSGWVALRDGHARVQLWRERLPTELLAFTDSTAAAFHAAPGGAPLPIALGDSGSYALQPLEVRGAWMRVLVVVPHPCLVASDADSRRTEAWIRFVDDRGRPRVWYSPRGC